jgi:hypothetical protein
VLIRYIVGTRYAISLIVDSNIHTYCIVKKSNKLVSSGCPNPKRKGARPLRRRCKQNRGGVRCYGICRSAAVFWCGSRPARHHHVLCPAFQPLGGARVPAHATRFCISLFHNFPIFSLLVWLVCTVFFFKVGPPQKNFTAPV